MSPADETLLDSVRASPRCEACGLVLHYPARPAKLYRRGPDVALNLVALGGGADCGCWQSHERDGVPGFRELLGVVAAREGLWPPDVVMTLYQMARRPKGEGHEQPYR